jgi:hypothetical protein
MGNVLMKRKLLKFIGSVSKFEAKCRIIRLRIPFDILQSAEKDASSWQRAKPVVAYVAREWSSSFEERLMG